MTECCIGAEENQQILQTVIAYMKEQKVPAYDEQTGKGIIRHILIRSGVYSRQIMVCIVAAADQLPSEDALVRSLCILPGNDQYFTQYQPQPEQCDHGKKDPDTVGRRYDRRLPACDEGEGRLF
jgi:tRNA/tmRNA/rRNA uracil-C5-methylase (TrmA/RlmC/RlmD family)